VHRLKSDRSDFRCVFDRTVLGIGQLLQTGSYGNTMIGHRHGALIRPIADGNRTLALLLSNAFDATARQATLVVHVEQPILEAGRSQIRYKNKHSRIAFGGRAVD